MNSRTEPPPPPRRPPEWIERNWKWVLPLSAGLLLAMMGIFAASVLTLLRRSEPYQLGLELVRNSSVARQVLGAPIEEGWLFTGSINFKNAEGWADFDVPISGPKGSGHVRIQAHTEQGRWRLEPVLLREDSDGRMIRLLPNATTKPTGPL